MKPTWRKLSRRAVPVPLAATSAGAANREGRTTIVRGDPEATRSYPAVPALIWMTHDVSRNDKRGGIRVLGESVHNLLDNFGIKRLGNPVVARPLAWA